MNKSNHPSFKQSLIVPLIFTAFLWLIHLIQVLLGVKFYFLAILPRTLSGLNGILTFQLVHGSWFHLFSNSIPLLALGTAVNYFFRPVAMRVFAIIYVLSGLLLWIGGRQVYHLGASGLVYGLAAFLFFSGIFSRTPRLWALSLIIIFLYGSLIWGIIPLDNGISWEGHLFGAFSGIFAAIYYRKHAPKRKKYSWEENEMEEDQTTDLWNFRHHFPEPGEFEEEGD